MVAFPKLNNELLTVSPADMISLSQVFKFAADTHFNDTLPNPELSFISLLLPWSMKERSYFLSIFTKNIIVH